MLERTGSDLLSHALRHSTISAESFHGRVRDGNVWFSSRYNHQAVETGLFDCGRLSNLAKAAHIFHRYLHVDASFKLVQLSFLQLICFILHMRDHRGQSSL